MTITRLVASLITTMTIASSLSAEMIYQSGTLGPMGITKMEVLSQLVLGTNIEADIWIGARFQVEQDSVTSRIGGHFVGGCSAQKSSAGSEGPDVRPFP